MRGPPMNRTPLPARRARLARKTGLARRSRSPAKQAGYRADADWQRAVVDRAGGRCAICGSRDRVCGHHLIPRRFKATRHELENGIALCNWHHWLAHNRQGLFAGLMRARLPEKVGDNEVEANAGAVPRRGSDVGTSPLLDV